MDSILLSDSSVENLQRMFKEVKNIPFGDQQMMKIKKYIFNWFMCPFFQIQFSTLIV